jgi:3-(3-hydroxy-phenyl)propionate hydroxylase
VLRIATPDGEYEVACDWLIVADGARSPVRALLGVEAEGQVFHDRFLIADIQMHSDVPTERRFWFDPPFHPNQSVLMHRQADDVWRVDFQLGWDADPDEEKKPENISRRLRAMLGQDVHFEIEWASVYTFECRRMQHFRHGRMLFAGDAAHLVSPFGARGANSGIQDADNLCWKLKWVIDGLAPERLLDSYDSERTVAADENIRNSTRATDFITPKSAISRIFRDSTLALAKRHLFARRLVNSGRLSVPTLLTESPLNSKDPR